MTFTPVTEKPAALLKVCPAYVETPLVPLPPVGAVKIVAKDETARMGLGSFKALGGVYAIAALLSEAHERQHGTPLSGEDFKTDRAREFASGTTFVCASAGNHGLSVAAGARIFGAGARVHLSATVPEGFAVRLQEKGADVIRSGAIYEESMAAASRDAETTGAVLLADGSWPGYTHPPSLVMEGYTVMAEEMREAFEKSGEWPTHVFLQAGVGGLAAAIACKIRENWSEQPQIFVVEPQAAPCLQEGAKQGEVVEVNGPVSEMGRLDCKEASLVALESLIQTANRFVTISDDEAALGVRFAHAAGLTTTPSGAAGLGAVLAAQRLDLDLKEGSRALVIISECEV
ncbi:MAG: diaminopropionate ammonia-lyase [Pseudomonadota bacterium]